jgi:hypothetical protein
VWCCPVCIHTASSTVWCCPVCIHTASSTVRCCPVSSFVPLAQQWAVFLSVVSHTTILAACHCPVHCRSTRCKSTLRTSHHVHRMRTRTLCKVTCTVLNSACTLRLRFVNTSVSLVMWEHRNHMCVNSIARRLKGIQEAHGFSGKDIREIGKVGSWKCCLSSLKVWRTRNSLCLVAFSIQFLLHPPPPQNYNHITYWQRKLTIRYALERVSQ